jgi:hypothetical protein
MSVKSFISLTLLMSVLSMTSWMCDVPDVILICDIYYLCDIPSGLDQLHVDLCPKPVDKYYVDECLITAISKISVYSRNF